MAGKNTYAAENGARSRANRWRSCAIGPTSTAKLSAATHPSRKSTLASENASANLCGRSARIGGARNMNEKMKQSALPTMHAMKPSRLALARTHRSQ